MPEGTGMGLKGQKDMDRCTWLEGYEAYSKVWRLEQNKKVCHFKVAS